MGIEVSNNIDSAVLCNKIQKSVDVEKQKYTDHLTQKLLDSLEYISIIEEKIANNPNSELNSVLTLLESTYSYMYDEAKKLELIDYKLLELAMEISSQKVAIYKETNQEQSNIHSRLYLKVAALL